MTTDIKDPRTWPSATIVPTDDPGDPPYHRELLGLTPEEFDSILGEPEPNPVPRNERKAKR